MFLSKPTCGDAEKKSNGDRQSTHCSCCRRTHFTENWNQKPQRQLIAKENYEQNTCTDLISRQVFQNSYFVINSWYCCQRLGILALIPVRSCTLFIHFKNFCMLVTVCQSSWLSFFRLDRTLTVGSITCRWSRNEPALTPPPPHSRRLDSRKREDDGNQAQTLHWARVLMPFKVMESRIYFT